MQVDSDPSKLVQTLRCRVPVLRVVLCGCVLAGAQQDVPHVEAQQTAVTRSGTLVAGELSSDRGIPVFAVSPEPALPIEQLQRIDFAGSPFVLPIPGPLRRIDLRNGDRLTGALVSLDVETAILRVRGHDGDVRVPLGAIGAISARPGLRDVYFENFERAVEGGKEFAARTIQRDDAHRGHGILLQSEQWAWPIEQLLRDTAISCWFRVKQDRTGDVDSGLAVDFRDGSTSHSIRVVLTNERSITVEGTGARRLAVQRLPHRCGWRKLTIRVIDRRLQILIDEHLLADGQRPAGEVARIALFRRVNDTAAATQRASEVVFDDLLAQKIVEPYIPDTRVPVTDVDIAVLEDGTRLFGALLGGGPHLVKFQVGDAQLDLAWSELRSLHLARRDTALGASDGIHARIALLSASDSPSGDGDALRGAIRGFDGRDIELQHPVFGDLRLPVGQVRRIEPEFRGRRIALSDGPHHLGDELRPEFCRPRAEGPRIEGSVELGDRAARDVFFAADVAELEPCGTGTPRGSRFLRELRSGGLLTELWVNDQRIGSFNEQIIYRSGSNSPERIRLRIPANCLRRGRNTWRIEQRPDQANPGSFDDFEMQRVALEIPSDRSGDRGSPRRSPQ